MVKDEPQPKAILVVDDDLAVPPALNRHIASVSIRPLSNIYDDGYDLALSAVLGGDELSLQIGDSEISIKLDIQFFEVDLTFARSSVSFGRGYDDFQDPSEGEERAKETQRLFRKAGAGGSISVSERLSGNLSLAAGTATETEVVKERSLKRYPYQHIEIGCLAVGNLGSPVPLRGNVVQDYIGWRVIPKTKELRSGVLARLRVKRNWIRMREPRVRGGLGSIGDRLKKMFGGKTEEEKLKAAAFPILLEKLVHLQLQEEHESEYATLAAAMVALKPQEEQHAIYPSSERRSIQVNLSIVEEFLSLTRNEVPGFLEEIERVKDAEILVVTENESIETEGSRTVQEESESSRYQIPQHDPGALVTAMEQARNAFKLADQDLHATRFGDVSVVDFLKSIGLFVVEENYVRGVDLGEEDEVEMVLAGRIVNMPDMKRVYQAFKILTTSREKMTEGRMWRDQMKVTNLISALFEVDDTSEYTAGEESYLETFLWKWCEFIRTHIEPR